MGFLRSQILVCKVLVTSKDFTDLWCGRIRENTLCILPTTKFMYAGHIYSINDGRYFDWPPGLQHYVDTIRQGRGQNPRRYSARYIASLTADLHRTILYGGIAMNPRSQLQLVHEANSLSFLVEQGGGRAIDGRRRILEIQPTHLHQRLSLFLGSRADVSELEAYGDVQQVINIHPEYDDDDEL
jgi:fructose-1,6-bisphosphatase I